MYIPSLSIILTWSLLAPIPIFNAIRIPSSFKPRQLPPEPNGVKTILLPNGVQIRYKEPGNVCEATPGVNSYSGYVDLAPDSHTFFWFFEVRHNPADAPITV